MKYGCIGEKLSHSFSKLIHNRLADYSYELWEIPKDKLDSFMKLRDFAAINVTIPYKEAVIPYLDEISPEAKKIGAVNTIINRDGKLYGYNTDFFGMRSLIVSNKLSPKGKKAIILGSGGTSKTAFAVLSDLGAREILKVSRNKKDGYVTYDQVITYHSDAEFIINTTPVGMYPNIGSSPIDISAFRSLQGVVDAVYNPLRSAIVCEALKRGIPAVGGLYMLVAQAAQACERFIKTTIPEQKIFDVYTSLRESTENVVLTGMPGAGKTTIGRIVAEKLGKQFYDSDEEIVKNAKMSISEIFEKHGEAYFRRLESDTILSLSALKNVVIATGGGAVLNSKNVDLLRENGRIYFIDRPLDSIIPTNDRPLSQDRIALEKRYCERYGIYCQSCDVHLEAGDDAEDNAKKIIEDFKNENTCY